MPIYPQPRSSIRDGIYTRRFDSVVSSLAPATRLDAGETAFFSRELENIEAQTYDVKYPELKARQLMSMGTGLTPADEYNTWRQFDRFGDAAEANMDTDDIPLVEVQGQEFQSKVFPIVIGYEYTVQDIRQAMQTNRPLDAMKAFAARDIVERKLEVCAAVGSINRVNNGIYGMLNQPNVVTISPTGVSGGGGSSTAGYTGLAIGSVSGSYTWGPYTPGAAGAGATGASGPKTPKEMVADLLGWFNQIQYNTNGVEEPDSLILDLNSYNYINTTQMNVNDVAIYTEGTVLQYILRNVPWLKRIDFWLPAGKIQGTLSATSPNQISTGPGGYGTTKTRAMLYKKDPRNFSFFVPQEFEQFAPQLKNFKFTVPCHARCGGVVCRYPRSALYIDGLQA